MSNNTTIPPVSAIVSRNHANGIIRYILKLEELCRRVIVVATHYNPGNPDMPDVFSGYVRSCYLERELHRPHIALIPDAIAFYADSDENHFKRSRYTHKYQSTSGQEYYVLDVAMNDTSLVVPLGHFVPYGRMPRRSAIVLDRIDPMPLWVVGVHGLGVSVAGGDVHTVEHGDKLFANPNGTIKTTVSVRIEWPGYMPEEKHAQVRMKQDGNYVGDSFTFKRLVNQVRSKVRKYINEHSNAPTSNPRWAVGNTHGRITAADLELLAIVCVSQGAVMPILKLRDDFEFADTVSTRSSFAAFPSTSTSASFDFFDENSGRGDSGSGASAHYTGPSCAMTSIYNSWSFAELDVVQP